MSNTLKGKIHHNRVSGKLNNGVIEIKRLFTPGYISFYNCPNESLENEIKNVDVRNVTSFYYTFGSCKQLKAIDISEWDTGSATTMSGMFSNCSQIQTIDLSTLKTNNVDNMSNMFAKCSNLTEVIGINNWDTSKVTTMQYMFDTVSKITTVDFSNCDMRAVTTTNNMLVYGYKLKTFKFGKTSSALQNTSQMFQWCSNLLEVDLNNIDMTGVTNSARMFYDNERLSELDMSWVDMPNNTTMEQMFSNCYALKRLDLRNCTIPKVKNMTSCFWGLRALEYLDIRNMDFKSVTTHTNMFGNGTVTYDVPENCEIIVKDDTARDWILARKSTFTNIKTVAELEAETSA